MNSQKSSISQIGKYLREISVVVIGVAITLSVGVWISNSSEKRNLALNLNALKLELERNAESFEQQAQKWQKSVKYANYLKSHDEKSVNQDSIAYYAQNGDGFGWGYFLPVNIFDKNAFEMFKTSSVMSQVDDKELLMSIWKTYSNMEFVQRYIDLSLQIKREEVMKEVQLRMDGKQITVPTKIFYLSGWSYDMVYNCMATSKMLRETISQLEKSKYLINVQ